MFKVLVHGCQEARCKPSFGIREVFHSEKQTGYFSPLLETSLKLSNTPLYRVPARFHQKSDFIRLWRAPVAFLGQEFDRLRHYESPFVAWQWWYLLMDRNLYCLQPGRVLIPSPSLISSHNFLQNPLASSMLSNIRESSRAPFPGSLYLGRSFSGSLFNIPLKFANTLPGTVLNCWLITGETSCFFFLWNPRFNFRSSDLFFSM